MRNIVKLPHPLFKSRVHNIVNDFLYGLAYDSVNDDYKILKIGIYLPSKTELYSLKNNCWRKIKSFSSDVEPSFSLQRCEFVDGRLHWIGLTTAGAPIIVSFDLSSEKHGEVAQPQYDAELNFKGDYDEHLEVVALRGMLCASLNYTNKGRFVLWVMEEYGIEKSWTKRFDIDPYANGISYDLEKLTPLYFSDNNDLLVKMYETSTDYMYIAIYRNGEARPMEIVKCRGVEDGDLCDAFLYVESLISYYS